MSKISFQNNYFIFRNIFLKFVQVNMRNFLENQNFLACFGFYWSRRIRITSRSENRYFLSFWWQVKTWKLSKFVGIQNLLECAGLYSTKGCGIKYMNIWSDQKYIQLRYLGFSSLEENFKLVRQAKFFERHASVYAWLYVWWCAWFCVS